MPAPVGGRRRPIVRPSMGLDWQRGIAFGQIVRDRRIACRLDGDALARYAGIDPDDLAQIEDNGTLPTMALAFALADALGTDLADLLHDTRRRAEELAAERTLADRTGRQPRLLLFPHRGPAPAGADAGATAPPRPAGLVGPVAPVAGAPGRS